MRKNKKVCEKEKEKEREGKGEGIGKYEKKRQNMKGWEREKE